MVVVVRYYATLGYTPAVLLDVQAFPEAHITVFHGDVNVQQRESNEKASVILGELGNPFEFVVIDEPWDFRQAFQAFRQRHAKHRNPKDLVVSASGGTEVFNSAATLFALLTGLRCRYVNRKSRDVVEVDYGLLREGLSLAGTRRNIVDAAAGNGGSIDVAVLAKNLEVTPSAISQAIQGLTKGGLLDNSYKGTGRGKVVRLNDGLWPMQT